MGDLMTSRNTLALDNIAASAAGVDALLNVVTNAWRSAACAEGLMVSQEVPKHLGPG